jgi:copper homeostasis protein CutC
MQVIDKRKTDFPMGDFEVLVLVEDVYHCLLVNADGTVIGSDNGDEEVEQYCTEIFKERGGII